jgi:homoserine kinase
MPKAPKAPAPDPSIKADQKAQRQMEQDRMQAEKKKQLVQTKKHIRRSGVQSLITGTDLSGFGSNY